MWVVLAAQLCDLPPSCICRVAPAVSVTVVRRRARAPACGLALRVARPLSTAACPSCVVLPAVGCVYQLRRARTAGHRFGKATLELEGHFVAELRNCRGHHSTELVTRREPEASACNCTLLLGDVLGRWTCGTGLARACRKALMPVDVAVAGAVRARDSCRGHGWQTRTGVWGKSRPGLLRVHGNRSRVRGD